MKNRLKKVFVIIFLFYSTHIFSQYGEYRYFSYKLGLTSSFNKFKADSFINIFGELPVDNISFKQNSGYIEYTPGLYAGFVFNYDFKNDYFGIMLGAEYEQYGISAEYISDNDENRLKERFRTNQIHFPLYFKIGKKLYKKQRYFYTGAAFDYNFYANKTEIFDDTKKSYKLNKSMFKQNNIRIIAGFNYMFLNIEIGYIFGSFLNKEFETEIFNKNTIVKPFNDASKGLLTFKTGICVPLNSWTHRPPTTIEMWIRRLFR